jgi:hypothetical protein
VFEGSLADARLLEGLAGYLQVDGNPNYEVVEKAREEVRLVGCLPLIGEHSNLR